MVNWLQTRLVRIALLITLLLTLVGCRFGQRPTPTPIALPASIQARDAAASMQTFPVTRGEVIQLETFSGRVTPAREEDLFFRRSGQIAQVFVEDGDLVEEGDVIASLDNEVLEIDLESALIGLAIAKDNLREAQEDLIIQRERAENSLEIMKLRLQGAADRVDSSDPTLVSVLEKIRELELRQAELTLENVPEEVDPGLELNVQRAELAVAKVKLSILEGQITAPFAGEIRFINLPETEEDLMAASAYSAVARVVDDSQIKIELNLTRTQLESLAEGMAVQISTASLANQALEGRISALPRPFGTSQGSLTEVTLDNPEDNSYLREGVTVGVDVRLQSKPNAIIIPREALQEENQLYYVTVQENGETRRVSVAVGVVSNDYVEIIAGLEEGQAVVVPA
ncbi:MAG: efflux RND transporter periplasmic adaptor subunit [Caldilineaceae bacterium]|nr:efflux RND transporter periplasmic adaptor subunit [Caldilineaceae bacterium]